MLNFVAICKGINTIPGTSAYKVVDAFLSYAQPKFDTSKTLTQIWYLLTMPLIWSCRCFLVKCSTLIGYPPWNWCKYSMFLPRPWYGVANAFWLYCSKFGSSTNNWIHQPTSLLVLNPKPIWVLVHTELHQEPNWDDGSPSTNLIPKTNLGSQFTQNYTENQIGSSTKNQIRL